MKLILIASTFFVTGAIFGYLIHPKVKDYPNWSYCNGIEDRFNHYIDEESNLQTDLISCEEKLQKE